MMDGRRFFAALKKMDGFQDIPVVVLTTSNDEKDRRELLAMGARDFFTKPSSVDEWEKMLNQIVTKYLS